MATAPALTTARIAASIAAILFALAATDATAQPDREADLRAWLTERLSARSSRDLLPEGWEGLVLEYELVFTSLRSRAEVDAEWARVAPYPDHPDHGDGYLFQNSGAVHYADEPDLLHTLDGVRGRDLR